jgi:hypothetical protein
VFHIDGIGSAYRHLAHFCLGHHGRDGPALEAAGGVVVMPTALIAALAGFLWLKL